MKTFLNISIAAALLATTSVSADVCRHYDAEAIHDGHLTVSEAVDHYNCGKGKRVIVFAHHLTIHRPSPWNTDNWAKGIVQGLTNDFWVHGRVGLKKRSDGVIINPEKYNFDVRGDASTFRNVETIAGRVFARYGQPYVIVFKGYPKVITNGFTYGQ